MNTIATIAPRSASAEYEPRNDSGALRDLNQEESTAAFESEPEENERTDYSYDPEEDVIEMHLGKKMEENY